MTLSSSSRWIDRWEGALGPSQPSAVSMYTDSPALSLAYIHIDIAHLLLLSVSADIGILLFTHLFIYAIYKVIHDWRR